MRLQERNGRVVPVDYSIHPAVLVAFAVVVLGAMSYGACWAPCDELGWLPVKDMPARCLKVEVRP